MKAPKISVVMPVRDGARWLTETIQSVLAQTLPDFEFIIIDDGSTDDSPRIVENSSRGDARVAIIRQQQLGLVAALNCGLTAARGELIARIDADDIASPQRLERQYQYLEKHPEVGLLGTWAEEIDEQSSVCGIRRPPSRPDELARLLIRINPFLHSSTMMRKSVVQKVGSYRTAFEGAEDYDLWLRMAEVTDTANMPECLLQYRIHPRSTSYSARVRQLFSTRLAQRGAQARRVTGSDPTWQLSAPPDWHADLPPTIFADLVKLYRFLDLANSENIPRAKSQKIDISPLSDRSIVLSHAEREIAQLVLLNLLKSNMSSAVPKPLLLWHMFRLHPIRAINLGYKNLWKDRSWNRS